MTFLYFRLLRCVDYGGLLVLLNVVCCVVIFMLFVMRVIVCVLSCRCCVLVCTKLLF